MKVPGYSTRRGSDSFLYLKHNRNASVANIMLRPEDYTLKVDTTSHLTWLKCKPCVPHAPQEGPIYNPIGDGSPMRSPIYRPITGSDKICMPEHGMEPAGAHYAFHVAGPGGLSVHGYIARTDIARHAACGAWANSVLLLPHWGNKQTGFLRFGADVPHNPRYQTTRILPVLDINDSAAYYVGLVGVSLGARRLDMIHPEMFSQEKGGQSGTVIDLGTSVTVMAEEAYRVIEEAMWSQLKEHGAERVEQRCYGLCVKNGKGPPSIYMTCLAIVLGRRTMIGALQQVDTRFVFDLKDSKILFAPELCIKDTYPDV
nr:unnamed protein product [Digitaria exilis]